MALTETPTTQAPPAAPSRHDEKAIAFFGSWALLGLYLDGWAHIHDKPETFFSPWHGVLYSGVGAAVAYFAFRDFVLKRPSSPDRLILAGFLIFGAGAVGDLVWHEIFGIEVDLEALLSPTHLMLLTGGILMLSFGARAARDRRGGRDVSFGGFFPTLVSLTLTAALVMFFTQYLSAFTFGGLFGSFQSEVHGVASVFVTNAVLMGPTLFAIRYWDPPVGTFTFMYGVIALGVAGMFQFVWVTHVVAAALAGVLTDVLVRLLRPSPRRRTQALVFAAVVPVLIWSLWLTSIQANEGVGWPVELWTGTVFLAALAGVGLAVLAFPEKEPVT